MPMDLIKRRFCACVRLYRRTQPDSLGGQDVTWREGEAFDAAFGKPTLHEVEAAQREGLRETCDIYVSSRTLMRAGDLFRRASDESVWRVIGLSGARETPAGSLLALSAYRVERRDVS